MKLNFKLSLKPPFIIHDVSGSIYGYALEIRSINYNGNWFRHYNHKLYRTEDCARDAIYQMKDFKFYEGFEWRVVPLNCP